MPIGWGRILVFSFKNHAFSRSPVTSPLGDVQAELGRWLESGYGHYLLQQQQRCLREIPPLSGYHLLQLGMTPNPELFDGFSHLHQFSLASGCGTKGGAAVADFSELPLPCDSIDTLLLHHALDFSQSPHAVLREAVRVLMPGGHVVIIGFNPLSPWGLIKPFGRLGGNQAIWRYNSLLRGRVTDWLEVLHCSPSWLAWGGYQPPGSSLWWRDRMSGLERWGEQLLPIAGAFYVVVARKLVARPLYSKGLRWSRAPVPSFALRRMAPVEDREKLKESA